MIFIESLILISLNTHYLSVSFQSMKTTVKYLAVDVVFSYKPTDKVSPQGSIIAIDLLFFLKSGLFNSLQVQCS